MRLLRLTRAIAVFLLLTYLSGVLPADGTATYSAVGHSPGSGVSIPAGTTITVKNWRRYREFMPDGMIALFQGDYYWRMPTDVQMEVGPAVVRPLPKTYQD